MCASDANAQYQSTMHCDFAPLLRSRRPGTDRARRPGRSARRPSAVEVKRWRFGSAESSGSSRTTMAASADGRAEMERISALFPLAHPVPAPATHADLIPNDDLVLEQELLRNPDNMRTWLSYITHVEDANYRKRPLPDAHWSSEAVRLLGLLSDGSQRLALQRIVSLYERAVATFPTSYKLWRRYLCARARYVLGEPGDGADGARRRMLQSTHATLDMGPTLLDARRDEEQHDVWDNALDGVVGALEWRSLAAAYERALQWLPQMPRLWLDYLALFVHPHCSPALSRTHARRTFDRALRTLPGSLHLRVWKLYLRWAETCGGETARRVWRRYLAVDPSLSERYVAMLLEHAPEPHYADGQRNGIIPPAAATDDELSDVAQARVLEAAKLSLQLARRAAAGEYISFDGQSPYHLLLAWLELVERYPEAVGADDEDKIDRATEDDPLSPVRLPVRRIVMEDGLAQYADQAGRLWTGLATYYIKRGDLDTAQATFEEGMRQVMTVRDFTQIFDAYAETSENVLSYMMEELADDDDDETPLAEREAEVDARMQSFEALMERRPFLVNDVLLRRNADDVQEWEKRVALYGANDEQVVATYCAAIDAINPRKATANLHQLYIHFARFYEDGGSVGAAARDLPAARQIYEKAVKVPYRRVDDLAEVWCSWAEMEIRHGHYDEALRVMSRATSAPTSAHKKSGVSYYDENLPPQTRLFKSLKLWTFYTDLEESLGTLPSAQRAFDRIMELKIANAQVIINYARFLEEQQYFEEAFKVYERGVELFTYPVAFELWNVYLSKFVRRYGGSKLERARDLFEQALDKCPAHLCKPIFLQYGRLEEEHGLLRKAMNIYERAARSVAEKDRYQMYLYYIAKATANFGLAATRPIYETAIEVLPDRQAAHMCVRFAALERKLGEMDRARAIYAHASQFCNPKTQPEFWKVWNDFEIETGTEDTFREMLRIKRSVMAQYNTDTSYVSTSMAHAATSGATSAAPADAMSMLEAQNASRSRAAVDAPAFVAASKPVHAANAEQVGGDDEDLL